ncbi:MAG: hypothetical protein Q4E62_07135 [Sutterellaceae bacterium]|nr:hypothetical protein [Sutterellaceae bacterium]
MKRCLIARLIGLSLAALPYSIFAQESPVTSVEVAPAVSIPDATHFAPTAQPQSAEPGQPAPSSDAGTTQASADQQPAEPTQAAPDAMNIAITEGEQTIFNEPDDSALRIAFLMPQKDSAFEGPSLLALKGLLASNYASENPSRILLVYPGSNDSIAEQLDAAAMAGAMIAVGPIDRKKVEEIAQLNYVPLPVVTLNQIDLDNAVALTEEEIAAEKERVRLERLAQELQKSDESAQEDALAALIDSTQPAPQSSTQTAPVTNTLTETVDGQLQGQAPDEGVSIAAKAAVPGLVYADEISVSKVRYEPKIFPRNLLMLGLSMEDDASYIARMGVAALPETTESGEKPKVLLLDHDTPLEKRISQAFERELVDAGYAPDRMTVDPDDIRRVNQFFRLVVDQLDKDEFDEVPIDQEVDPVGWRQQQIRIRRLQAAKRARAALSEPPYYAAFLAMDAKTASQVRSRLPLRTRVWGTPIINPGDTKTNPQAKAMTYDLMHVGFTEAPLLLNFDIAAFEEKYKVPAPQNTLETRLFALGADAFGLAKSITGGASSGVIDGNLGTLHYNLSVSPLVERRGQTAMIYGGTVRAVSQDQILDFQSINTKSRPMSRLRAQSRSLERLEREAEAAAQAAGTLAPRQDNENAVDGFDAPENPSVPELDLSLPVAPEPTPTTTPPTSVTP